MPLRYPSSGGIRRGLTAVLVALLAGAWMTAGERVSDSLERPVAANRRISMDLSAGEYRITGQGLNSASEWPLLIAKRFRPPLALTW